MTSSTLPRRPISVWLAVGLLVLLGALSAVGGVLFNLAGADEPGEFLGGLIFLVLAASYWLIAVRLRAGQVRWWRAAIAVSGLHALFNLVVKVGIEGETESVMFIILALAITGLLLLPASRHYVAAGPSTTAG
jgi:hypothetical protein